jgi:hypothetical protein
MKPNEPKKVQNKSEKRGKQRTIKKPNQTKEKRQ